MLYINILFIIIVIGALIIDVLYLLFVLKSYIIFKYIIHLSNWNCFYLRFSSRKFLCMIKGTAARPSAAHTAPCPAERSCAG